MESESFKWMMSSNSDFRIARDWVKVLQLFDRDHVRPHSTKKFENMITDAGFKHAGVERSTGTNKFRPGRK